MNILKKILLTGVFISSAAVSHADYPVNYNAEAIMNAGNGNFAPYYIASNRHGVITQAKGITLNAGLWRDIDLTKRFSYSFGMNIYGGTTNSTAYDLWIPETETADGHWTSRKAAPANLWIQQLYAEVKYRGVYLSAGLKDRESAMLNFALSSGDMIESGNARSIPQLRAGFINFQDIPLTNRWLQIQGEIGYGKFIQNDYYEHHFNYYSKVINKGMLYNYKRLYFRTNPEKPFSATFGAQAACLFGGTSYYYSNGKLSKTIHNAHDLDAYWQAFIPRISGVEGYIQGQHLGSWDIKLRYRLRNGAEIMGYVQNLWEDGSGMGKLNGWDGLWGLEYKAAQKGWIDAAVLEYLQTTNQGGPMHWDPVDNPGTTLTVGQATGNDCYYNNGFYGPYANLGMAIGNPMLKSPIYQTNGMNYFRDNRIKAIHAGISGTPSQQFSYRVLASYRKSWGTHTVPYLETISSTSIMVEGCYKVNRIPGLDIKAQIAADHGKLYGNVTGALISVSYTGLLNFKK